MREMLCNHVRFDYTIVENPLVLWKGMCVFGSVYGVWRQEEVPTSSSWPVRERKESRLQFTSKFIKDFTMRLRVFRLSQPYNPTLPQTVPKHNRKGRL